MAVVDDGRHRPGGGGDLPDNSLTPSIAEQGEDVKVRKIISLLV